MADDPVREQSTPASSGHAKFFLIDVAAFNELIDTSHQIFEIVAGIMILDHVAEILAVSRAAARIRKQHHVTLRCHPLKLVFENVAVSCVGSAMNVEDQRIFFCGIKIRRLLHPGLNRFAIETFVGNFFRLSQIEFRENFLVNIG